jgi:hypothetical protein
MKRGTKSSRSIRRPAIPRAKVLTIRGAYLNPRPEQKPLGIRAVAEKFGVSIETVRRFCRDRSALPFLGWDRSVIAKSYAVDISIISRL